MLRLLGNAIFMIICVIVGMFVFIFTFEPWYNKVQDNKKK